MSGYCISGKFDEFPLRILTKCSRGAYIRNVFVHIVMLNRGAYIKNLNIEILV